MNFSRSTKHELLPKVTVVCLCYNTGDFVVKAIDCVIRTQYPNLEIIVIDDCSTDLVLLGHLENYLDNNKTIIYIKNPINLGIPKTLNIALKISTGKYISLVSDDIISETKIIDDVISLEKLCDDYVLVHSIAQTIDSHGIKYPEFSPTLSYPKKFNEYVDISEMIREPFIHAPTVMFRAGFLKSIGGWNEAFIFEDKPMWFLISTLGKKIHFRPDVSTFYRRHDKNISSKIFYGFYKYQFELHAKYDSIPEARDKLKQFLRVACGGPDFEDCLKIYSSTQHYSYFFYYFWRAINPVKKLYKKYFK
jgi:glycosyltransferase involved in cell wall biosynthesis